MPQNILLLSWRSSKSGGRKKIRSKRFFNLPFVVNVNVNYFNSAKVDPTDGNGDEEEENE